MSLDLTSGQVDATQRNTLAGAVYLLSGTLLSRVSGLADAPIRWSTHTFSGGPTGELWEAYLGPPDTIQEELAFKLGDESPGHPVGIPVRNLPFRHSESLLTAITDEDYAWEGSEATLFVGYLQPDQTPGDLASGDWTVLRKRGQFGSPQDIQQDGFRLPLLPRDSLRRQTLDWLVATTGLFPALDPADSGRVIPCILGAPDVWVPMIRVSGGAYGLTAKSVVSGTASGVYVSSNFDLTILSGKQVYLHRADKLLTVAQVEDLRQTAAAQAQWQLIFSGGLIDFNIPQGALFNERLATSGYFFLPSINPILGSESGPSQWGGIKEVAWETLDGRIVPFQLQRLVTSNFEDRTDPAAPFGVWSFFRILDTFQPPALVPRINLPSNGIDITGATVDIDTQPEFTPSVDFVSATKMNYPTGPGGASAAFDGSDNTGFSVAAFGSVTFTFPSVAAPFANGDTVRSVLRFVSQGTFTVSDGGATTFATPTGSKDSYTINLGTPQNYNQSVRFTAGSGGGVVYELSWEHELEATLTVDRTTDVTASVDISASAGGESGYEMVPVKHLLAKMDGNFMGGFLSSARFGEGPWQEIVTNGTNQRVITRPTNVFANLQRLYLEKDSTGWPFFNATQSEYEGFIDLASYDAAEAQYRLHDIRFNFAITEAISWPDLERQLALQCRTHAFYGPNGHQLIFIPDEDELATIAVEETFFLPGTPNPNVAPAGGALIERTSPSEIINQVDLAWKRQWHLSANAAVAERFLRRTSGSYQASVDVFTPRLDPEGAVLGYALSDQCHELASGNVLSIIEPPFPFVVSGGFNVHTYASAYGAGYSAPTQTQDLADFLAQRNAWARTRFRFETAWRAFGLTQGSLVRVAYASAPNVFRNVVCEVEDIQTSPINAERRIITARSISQPLKGLEPAYTWEDLFVLDSDAWTTRITGPYDRWDQYWAVRS